MPPKSDPSKARFFSARFNPVTSEEDRRALEYIDQWMADRYNFKAIITDAILHRAGHRPEMFSQPSNALTVERLEDILADFAESLIKRLGERPQLTHVAADGNDEDTTSFSRNFAIGFLQRQKSGGNE